MIRHSHALLVVLTLVSIVFVSGCTESGGKFSIFGLEFGPGESRYTQYENMIIETEIIPPEVYEGKSATVFFDIYNEGNTTLRDINLRITDLAGFTTPETSMFINEIKEGETGGWSLVFNSAHTDVRYERDQTIRYMVDYRSNSSATYDIAVMSEEEYTRLERQEALNETNLFYFKTKSPVEIDISISKEQPIFEGLEFYFYVTLNDLGGGSIDSVQDLAVYYPSSLVEFVESNDFRKEADGKMVLKKPLDFYNKETKKTTCKFRAKSVNISNVGQFKAETNYIYEYHKTINIKVKPK